MCVTLFFHFLPCFPSLCLITILIHFTFFFFLFFLYSFQAYVCYFFQIFIFSSNDSPSKIIKNIFYFMGKALFVLKIFKYFVIFSLLFHNFQIQKHKWKWKKLTDILICSQKYVLILSDITTKWSVLIKGFFWGGGFNPCKAEEPLWGMELQEKKHKKDHRIQKICLERTYS